MLHIATGVVIIYIAERYLDIFEGTNEKVQDNRCEKGVA